MALREKIVSLVNENFAKVSRQFTDYTVLLITLKTGDLVIKMVFWQPRNYMLVAHDYEAPKEAGAEVFNITSYHDSCWRYDGFSFLNKLTREQSSKLEIVSTEILEFQDCFKDESEKYFVILKS